MKRSIRCDYALRAILELAHYYENKPIRACDIARSQEIPNKYLEQIMMQLRKAGFVISKKGPQGGYSLAKPPENIFLGEIIRLIDPRLFAFEATESFSNLKTIAEARLSFFGVWAEVQQSMSSVLDQISLQDILKRESEILSRSNQGFIYYI